MSPWAAIKSRILAKFMWSRWKPRPCRPQIASKYWTMYFDGSFIGMGSRAGVVLISPVGDRLRYTVWLHFASFNNIAEYEALIHGLCIASDLGARCLYVWGDSKQVIDQVMKDVTCWDDKMTAYCDEACKLDEKSDTTTKRPTSWPS